jgi:hypothetical protein
MKPSEETCVELQKLHITQEQPPLRMPKAIESAQNDDEMLKSFTLEFFERELKATKSGTAPGSDGWSADAIKRMCLSNKTCMSLFFVFYQSMLRTKVYPSALFLGSSIGIQKLGKPKPRPITIPQALEKLLARIILKLEHRTFEYAINKNQMGVNKKLGTERIITAIQTLVDI